jgi:hypothetical protein
MVCQLWARPPVRPPCTECTGCRPDPAQQRRRQVRERGCPPYAPWKSPSTHTDSTSKIPGRASGYRSSSVPTRWVGLHPRASLERALLEDKESSFPPVAALPARGRSTATRQVESSATCATQTLPPSDHSFTTFFSTLFIHSPLFSCLVVFIHQLDLY